MATWAEIRNSVRDHLWRTEDDALSDALIQTHMVAAQEFICKYNKRKWHWLEAVKRATTDDLEIDVPVDFKDVISLAVSDDDGITLYPLKRLPISLLRTRWPSDSTGTPEDYALYNQKFYLGPIPDREMIYELHYRKALSPIAIEDASNSNVLTARYPLALVYRTCSTIAAGVLIEPDRAQHFAQLFQSEIDQMEDEDDAYRDDMLDGMVQPDRDFYDEAFFR